MKIRHTFMLIAFSLAMVVGGNAIAQQSQMQQQPAQTDVSEQELQQFAEAQVQISEIQQDFAGRLQNVEDPEKAHELQIQANEEMTDAVEGAGLDVESFNNIAMAIQNDPELQQRLTTMLQNQR